MSMPGSWSEFEPWLEFELEFELLIMPLEFEFELEFRPCAGGVDIRAGGG